MSSGEQNNGSEKKSESPSKSPLSTKTEEFASEIRKDVIALLLTARRDALRAKLGVDGLFAVPFLAILAWGGMENLALKAFALLGVYFLMLSHHAFIAGFFKISFLFKILTIIVSHAIAFWLIYALFSHIHITVFFEG